MQEKMAPKVFGRSKYKQIARGQGEAHAHSC